MSRVRRAFTDEYKKMIVQRVADGEKVATVCKEQDIALAVVYGWKKLALQNASREKRLADAAVADATGAAPAPPPDTVKRMYPPGTESPFLGHTVVMAPPTPGAEILPPGDGKLGGAWVWNASLQLSAEAKK